VGVFCENLGSVLKGRTLRTTLAALATLPAGSTGTTLTATAAFTARTPFPAGTTEATRAALATAALRTVFVGGQLAVVVLVQLLEGGRGLLHLLGIDGTILVGVERIDERVDRALPALSALAAKAGTARSAAAGSAPGTLTTRSATAGPTATRPTRATPLPAVTALGTIPAIPALRTVARGRPTLARRGAQAGELLTLVGGENFLELGLHLTLEGGDLFLLFLGEVHAFGHGRRQEPEAALAGLVAGTPLASGAGSARRGILLGVEQAWAGAEHQREEEDWSAHRVGGFEVMGYRAAPAACTDAMQ
jgi:hypothetical protein